MGIRFNTQRRKPLFREVVEILLRGVLQCVLSSTQSARWPLGALFAAPRFHTQGRQEPRILANAIYLEVSYQTPIKRNGNIIAKKKAAMTIVSSAMRIMRNPPRLRGAAPRIARGICAPIQ